LISVEGVPETGADRQAAGELPVILYEILLKARALLDLLLLQINREGLDLAEQETGEGGSSVADTREI
jgi:hypothetical protein